MSPDISTRCLQCGAAVRPDALFCPECGRASNQVDQPDRESADNGMASTEMEDLSDEEEPERNEEAVEPEPSDDGSADEAMEPVEVAVDPLSERLAKLKAEAEAESEAARSATIPSVPAEKMAAVTSPVARPVVVIDKSKKRSTGGRVVASSRGSSRWSAVSKPAKVLTVDPALRFLLVTAGLIVFSLLVYLLSRYLK